MYGIYLEGQRIAKTKRFEVLPSGALECRNESGGRIQMTLAPGSWDAVHWEEGL